MLALTEYAFPWSALSSENILHNLFWGIPVTLNCHLKAKYWSLFSQNHWIFQKLYIKHIVNICFKNQKAVPNLQNYINSSKSKSTLLISVWNQMYCSCILHLSLFFMIDIPYQKKQYHIKSLVATTAPCQVAANATGLHN